MMAGEEKDMSKLKLLKVIATHSQEYKRVTPREHNLKEQTIFDNTTT